MGIESRGGPGADISKKFTFDLPLKKFLNTFFRKVNSSTKFSYDLFSFLSNYHKNIPFLSFLVYFNKLFVFTQNRASASEPGPRAAYPSDQDSHQSCLAAVMSRRANVICWNRLLYPYPITLRALSPRWLVMMMMLCL